METGIRKTLRSRSHAARVALSLIVALGVFATTPVRAQMTMVQKVPV